MYGCLVGMVRELNVIAAGWVENTEIIVQVLGVDTLRLEIRKRILEPRGVQFRKSLPTGQNTYLVLKWNLVSLRVTV